MLNPLTLTVENIQGNIINAKSADGKTWSLPMETVHGTPKPGQEIRLIGVTVGAEDIGTSAFAQTLLQEILGGKTA
ncbi:hypothetical protein EXS71_00185 [Candidatus Uhrbacteria bacterium]|nr:hypothetical protein [Candidatus Uhrbacteria bacterium]